MVWRRRNYLINRRYQLKYIASFVGITLLSFLVSGALVIRDIYRQIDVYLQRPTVDISRTGEIILPVVFKASASASVLMLVALAGLSILYVRHTRWVAGQLDEGFARLKSGELNHGYRIGLGRDFNQTEDAYNGMLDVYKARIAAMQESAADISRATAGIKAAVAGGGQVGDLVAELRGKTLALDEGLSGLKLD